MAVAVGFVAVNRVLLGPVSIAGVLWGLGILLVLTYLDPQRNPLTRTVYRLWTILPRVGSMTDRQWILMNGVVLLVGGTVLVSLFFLGFF